jgi:TonB family protein
MARPKPDYPPVAKINYLQGLVKVRITVTQQGRVASAHVLQGNAILAVEALKATRRWIYRPLATAKGPSGFITTVKLNFTLGNAAGDLTPQRAEHDFLRQVKPPQTLVPPVVGHSQGTVRVHLLVNEEGQVVDRDCGARGRPHAEAACEISQGWKFRPAFWGNLPIASYLDVDVPVDTLPLARTATLTGSR